MTSDKLRIRRLRKVLREALRKMGVSEGSIPDFIRNVEEGIKE